MGAQAALGRRARPAEAVDAILAGLVERVARRMRAAGRTGRTVVLRLRFDDFTRATRSHTLPRATDRTQTLLTAARALFAGAAPAIATRGLTLVGVAVGNLDDDAALQLELPFDIRCGLDLDAAVDAVRDRFGGSALTRGTLVGRELAPAVPMLPD
jgi:DNA polymerase IV